MHITFTTGLIRVKLYNCIMVYNANEYWLKTMDKEKPYYFSIEAINENGIGETNYGTKIRIKEE